MPVYLPAPGPGVGGTSLPTGQLLDPGPFWIPTVYPVEVLKDNPYVYYPDASAAPWNDHVGTRDITITGATANQTGPLLTNDNKAFSFNGTSDFGQVSLDLSDTTVVTMEMWLWWDSFGTGFDLAYEHSANWSAVNGGLVFDPDHSSGNISIGHTGNVGSNEKLYPRPSAAAWHHYAIVHDLSQSGADEITAYLDGLLWTPSSQPSSSDNSTASGFANSTLNVMCRDGSTLFGAGDMAHLAVYKSALSPARIYAHYEATDGTLPAEVTTTVKQLAALGVG